VQFAAPKGTKNQINACLVCSPYFGQIAKKPDFPVKNRTPGNPITTVYTNGGDLKGLAQKFSKKEPNWITWRHKSPSGVHEESPSRRIRGRH